MTNHPSAVGLYPPTMWRPSVLPMDPDRPYRAGHPPHDAANGLRVGAFAGGVLGAIVVWLFGVTSIWVVVAGAVLGGGYGYVSQLRKSRS